MTVQTLNYEIEHIWADHPQRHTNEFSHPSDLAEHRNRIGGLLLLPKSFNASYVAPVMLRTQSWFFEVCVRERATIQAL